MSETNDFSIGAVARLTGISQHTLRIWERRYGVEPSRRSKGGRRLYSGDDVERLTILKALVDRGDRIGKIAMEDTQTLRERMAAFENHSVARSRLATGTVELAVLGETLGESLRKSPMPGSRVLLADTDADRFQADLTLLSPDAMILEFPYIDAGTMALVTALQQSAGTDNLLVVYGFGRMDVIEQMTHRGIKVLRAPVSRYALSRLIGLEQAAPGKAQKKTDKAPSSAKDASMAVPPRKLSAQSLQRLGEVVTSVDCECPHHLVDLVRSLSAFELYSRHCQDRNADDAALHAYLHSTTAHARALMEEALIRTAEAEGIDY